ncbi:multicopper oxidase domain-containing protein [Nostoc ellipsosporum NOK]|nr:multicopper oxidase domain-containing protein [Nostoc ellipsosporum NOK]
MFKTSECNYHYLGLIRAWKMVAFAAFISVLMMTFSAPSVQAAPAVSVVENPPPAEPILENRRILENPPVLELRKKPTLTTPRLGKPTTRSDGKVEKEFDLNIVYTPSKLYNPATQRDDNVQLRSYVGTGTSPDTPYVAPTIEAKPGDTVRINLNNQLPADDPSCINVGDKNNPHCFNNTNLHSHGLWVSPSGNSDNVLVTIKPNERFTYEYNIPPDHPAGTFWYHPHLHGSTALQVASGMAGALIVRGDRLPSESANGDIDTLLKGADIKERVLVLQQIPYACGLDVNQNVIWACEPNQTGEIESYNGFGPSGPNSWLGSGRYTSINGLILPTFLAKSGEIERWRMIHAGLRETISLEFRKLEDTAPSINTLRAADADRYIGKNCTGKPIDYHVIADDGLTRSQAWQTRLTTLQPGYRSDALVVFPEPGRYCVVDTSAPPSGSVTRNPESRQLLGIVIAEGNTVVPDIHDYLTEKLINAAYFTLPVPGQFRDAIIDDLENSLKLTAFTPHPDIQDKELTGKQELAFFIDVYSTPPKFEVSNVIGPNFAFNPYDFNRIDRELTLGGADEWTLESYFVGHPFHIHVNPFQIVKILDPNGNDISLPNGIDNPDGKCERDPKDPKTPKCDPQYPGLKGVWKDTLWVKSLISNPPPKLSDLPPKTGLYTIVVRSRYQRYTGEFVLHCHILDHEDQGMMQNVSIVDLTKGVGKKAVSQN